MRLTGRQPTPGHARFDRWAPNYDRSIRQRLLFGPVHDAVLGAFGAASGPPHELLDLGCGTGRLLEAAARRWATARCTGIDVSAVMLAAARRDHAGDARFVFAQGDAAALPLASDAFDAVVSTLSFHHWRDQAAGIREVARVLRPGGRFVLADIDAPFLARLRPVLNRLDDAHLQAPEVIHGLLARAGLAVETRRRCGPLAGTHLVVARKARRHDPVPLPGGC